MNSKKIFQILIIVAVLGITGFLLLDRSENVQEYLEGEESVMVWLKDGAASVSKYLPIKSTRVKYIEVVDSCDYKYEGDCVIARSGPSTSTEAVERLRKGMVLRVGGEVKNEGSTWYKITFDDQHLYYPERLKTDWYISADHVTVLYREGTKTVEEGEDSTTAKRIVVDRSNQTLVAYEKNGDIFMEAAISTGLELSPTPLGTYEVFKKMPSRYMQGPLPGSPDDDVYDLQGVPWNLYFTGDGAVIHGAYWHESFGSQYSHGCVNLPPEMAKLLYDWADLGTKVEVKE